MNEQNSSTNEVELKKCADDFFYFCETYIKITNPKKGLIPFKLFDYQKRFIKELLENRFVIGKKFRQGGFSTLEMAYILWNSLFKKDYSSVILTRNKKDSLSYRQILKLMIEYLPDFFLAAPVRCNEKFIKFKNNNTIWYASNCRGLNANYLSIQESAFIKNMEYQWKCLFPIVSRNGHVCAMSTVNDASGWFYDTITKADKKENDFHVFDVNYQEHPDYQKKSWVENTRKALGEDGWAQEVLGEFHRNENKKSELKNDLPQHNRIFKNINFPSSKKEEAEILKQLTENCRKNTEEFKKNNYIKDNKEMLGLVGFEDLDGCGYVSRHNGCIHPFQQYVWQDVSEEIAEEHIFLNDDYNLFNCIEQKKKNIQELEDRINENVDEEIIYLAGLSKNPNEIEASLDFVDKQIIKKIKELNIFDENIKFSFIDKKLCINKLQTTIQEFDLCCLFNGLLAFFDHETSITHVAKLVCEKLTLILEPKEPLAENSFGKLVAKPVLKGN